MAILNWHLGIRPKGYLDTLSMANALHGINESVSLKSLAERYGLPAKGTEVHNAVGLRRADFSAAQLEAYGEYCRQDVWLCRTLFDIMSDSFSKAELKAISTTIRMFVEPILELDLPLLKKHLIDVREGQHASLLKLVDLLKVDSEADVKTILMSNDKFATLLRKLGVEPPTKISPTTQKQAYAFAKTDDEFTALLEHEAPMVQAAVAARLGNKTTIEESRTEAFIAVAERGPMPFPLKYSGAAVTHRWSGFDGINVQNMGRGSVLRQSIKAPKGYKIVSADLSNIELRLGLYLAQQDDKVQLIADGVDLYVDIAVPVFKKSYGEIVDLGKKSRERTTGKVISLSCIAEGELVLTDHGLIPIEKVPVDYRVWDGLEFVTHAGPIYQGERDVIQYQGLEATPDHIVYLQDGSTCEFGVAANKGYLLARTGDGGRELRVGGYRASQAAAPGEALISTDTVHHLPGCEVGRSHEPREGHCWMPPLLTTKSDTVLAEQDSDSCKGAVHQSNRSWVQELRRARDYIRVRLSDLRRAVGAAKSTGETEGVPTRQDRQRQGVHPRQFAVGLAEAEYKQSARVRGDTDTPRSENKVSARPIRRQHAKPVVEDSDCGGDCSALGAPLVQTKRKVWDILNAGPRHRFTVGGLLVSNCVYGTGAAKLRDTLRLQGKVRFSQEETQAMTDLYRGTYTNVVDAWNTGKDVLDAIYAKSNYGEYLRPGILNVTSEGIVKPSGLVLKYPDLKWTKDKDGKMGYTYEQKRKTRDRVYGSKVFQRCTQSLARDIICEHMLKIDKRYLVVGTVHDEIICVVADDEVESAKAFMLEVMRTPPSWAPDLPLDAEVEASDNYGGAH